jgi:hypothetical protein
MNEPIYTGPLPVQVSGDLEQGKRYERIGRKMLGTLLNVSGASERIARGEPGGYFKKSLQMADGAVVTVTTNNGNHYLRIDTPRSPAAIEYRHEHQVATGSTPHTVFVPEAKGLDPSHDVPLPKRVTREIEDEVEEKKKQSVEYMWVGVRYTTPDVPWYVMNSIMIEPDTGPKYVNPDDGNSYPKRGIVDSQDLLSLYGVVLARNGDEFSYDENVWWQRYTIDASIEDAYKDWTDPWSDGRDHAETHMQPGAGVGSIDITIGGDSFQGFEGRFLASANGLRMESINIWQETNVSDWLGFDPLAKDQTGQDVRVLGDRHVRDQFGHIPAPKVLWDVVYTLDPHEDEMEPPVDSRKYMLNARRFLEKNAGMKTQVLPGEYILALMCYDTTPQLQSTRAGEAIPGFSDPNGLAIRRAEGDYDEYMKPINTTTNLGVEVEVRLGKGAEATTFHFTTTIPESNDDMYANKPYGIDWHEPCSPIGGPNPAGPNFAPQYIAIDVYGGSARWVDKGEVDLYPILGGGVYSYPGDDRVELDVYFHVVPWAQPDDSYWHINAGKLLWKFLEAATSGVYGLMKFHDPGGEAACIAMLEGKTKGQLWKYDAWARTLTTVPVVSEFDDYPYGWIEDPDMPDGGYQSPYTMELWFYYPYKILGRQQCRHTMGFSFTAVEGQYSFDHGQHLYALDPPDTTDCC